MSVIHPTVNTIAELREYNLTSVDTGSTFHVCGYHSANDDGGGVYYWDSGSNVAPNMGTIIAPKGAYHSDGDPPFWDSGRWLLLHNGTVTVKQFGAIGARSANPQRLDQLDGSGLPFTNVPEIEAIYKPYLAGPFSGLDVAGDTMDWAAIQMAVLVCGKGEDFTLRDNEVQNRRLPGIEVPSGTYLCSRPVWLGDDQYYNPGEESGGKQPRQLGLSLLGQRGGTREQVDFSSANIWLINDRTNWYCLSMSHAAEATNFQLRATLGDKVYKTVDFTIDSTISEFVEDLQDALDNPDPGVYLVESMMGMDDPALRSQNLFFRVTKVGAEVPEEFVGEILPITDDDPKVVYADFVHCFPDSAVLSFRRTASMHYRVENISLRGNNGEAEQLEQRNASFGFLYVSTQFFGHIVQNSDVADVDTAVGILQGTGENGEQTRMDRIHAEPVRRMLYTNAPQAFHQEFIGWNAHLQNTDKDLVTNLVFAVFDNADTPGFGANFFNAGATFATNQKLEEEGFEGTLVRIRRGTGAVQFIGGRAEHMTRLVHYDALSDQKWNNNLDLIIRGMEFTVMGGDERRLIDGDPFGQVVDETYDGTQYGVYVEDCTFQALDDRDAEDPHPEWANFILESVPADRLRCVFEKCRFIGTRSIQTLTIRVDFDRCYKGDFIRPGWNDSYMRQFTQSADTPGDRTQSLRSAWQDTPWIQTGPRSNVLKNSDLEGQTPGTNVGCDANFWEVNVYDDPGTPANFGAFGKWGQTGISNLGDVSPGPESFGMIVKDFTTVFNTIDFVDLDTPDPVVLTYQALVRVKGKLDFKLVNSTDRAMVYDYALVGPALDDTEYTSPILVTLRLQRRTDDETGSPQLRIENDTGDDALLQVYWQHAWAGGGASALSLEDGLRNMGHVRNPGGVEDENTYVWGVNATSVRAAQRFQLPLKDEEFGWLAATPTGMDLADGEVYYDQDQAGVVLLAADKTDWFMVCQPERFRRTTGTSSTTMNWARGDEKNLISEVTGLGSTVTTSIDDSSVIGGTVVRVYRLKTGSLGTGQVVITASGTTYASLTENRMAEFVFDGTAGVWVCTQFDVAVK